MKIHYSEFEFGFEDIDYDPDDGDIKCKIFIDTVHPLTGKTKRIYIENIDILNYMIDCQYDDLKETYFEENPDILARVITKFKERELI